MRGARAHPKRGSIPRSLACTRAPFFRDFLIFQFLLFCSAPLGPARAFSLPLSLSFLVLPLRSVAAVLFVPFLPSVFSVIPFVLSIPTYLPLYLPAPQPPFFLSFLRIYRIYTVRLLSLTPSFGWTRCLFPLFQFVFSLYLSFRAHARIALCSELASAKKGHPCIYVYTRALVRNNRRCAPSA